MTQTLPARSPHSQALYRRPLKLAEAIRMPPFLRQGGAACHDPNVDPDLFFPEAGEQRQYNDARKICARCPLREPCGEWAITTQQPYGLWSGMKPEEIKAALRCRTGNCKHPEHWSYA